MRLLPGLLPDSPPSQADRAFVGRSAHLEGVGDDSHSWSFDGHRCRTYHGSGASWGSFGERWKAGDVVGCTVNIDKGVVKYSLNGDWGGPMSKMGVAFEGITFDSFLRPAISCQRPGQFRLNMGSAPFSYPPPQGYRAV